MQILILILVAITTVIILFAVHKYVTLSHYANQLENELSALKETHEEMTGESTRVANEQIPIDLTDTLTGLPGRKVFEDRLEQAIYQSKRQKRLFSVLALEIDSFNDIKKLGQDVSDALLKEFANRLQMSIRQVDTVTRFADGHFLIFLPHLVRPETAIYVAQRVQDNLIQSFLINSYELKVTACLGIAVYPVDGTTVEILLRNAESALRQATANGKNKYQFYQSELHYLGERELEISQLIRSPDLFERLIIQYKPFFNVTTNEPFYIQATPHIRHAKLGMISFEKFLSIAENSGKMMEINEWLLKNSLFKLNQWAVDGFKPDHLAIPISLRQLENPHFITKINTIIQDANQLTINIVLEIIDDNWAQNIIFIEKLFSKLNDSNIKISVGVIALAHFALQKVRQIPLNYLRLDSKLIQGMMTSQSKDDILRNMIELARIEKITVMAEGVNDEKIKQSLKLIGCDVMEGKVFGYLMPTGTILENEKV